jgi:hypothetical protein
MIHFFLKHLKLYVALSCEIHFWVYILIQLMVLYTLQILWRPIQGIFQSLASLTRKSRTDLQSIKHEIANMIMNEEVGWIWKEDVMTHDPDNG